MSTVHLVDSVLAPEFGERGEELTAGDKRLLRSVLSDCAAGGQVAQPVPYVSIGCAAHLPARPGGGRRVSATDGLDGLVTGALQPRHRRCHGGRTTTIRNTGALSPSSPTLTHGTSARWATVSSITLTDPLTGDTGMRCQPTAADAAAELRGGVSGWCVDAIHGGLAGRRAIVHGTDAGGVLPGAAYAAARRLLLPARVPRIPGAIRAAARQHAGGRGAHVRRAPIHRPHAVLGRGLAE